MKKLIALFAAALCIVSAASAAPTVEKVEVEPRGRVEVEFVGHVEYENASVSLFDETGASISAEIIEKDDDDLAFRADGLNPASTYLYEISGIRSIGESAYGSVSGDFKTADASEGIVGIREVEYEDGELEIAFDGKVSYENVSAVLVSTSGETIEARIDEKDSDDLELYVGKLQRGESYTVSVTGIGPKDSGEFGEASIGFTVQ